MYPKNKDTSPIELTDGIYELVLIRVISEYRNKYSRDGLILVFKVIGSETEITRTISIPNDSVKSMTTRTIANNFINLIIGELEDTLELRRDPKKLAEKMTIFGGGRIFKGVIAKNERNYLDLISIGEERRQK